MRLLLHRASPLVPLRALALNGLSEHPQVPGLAGYTVMNICIALTIDRMVRFPAGLGGRLLNGRCYRFIGVPGYSLYPWQQLF